MAWTRRAALIVCAGLLPAPAQAGPHSDLMALAEGFVLTADVQPRPDPSNRLTGLPLAIDLGEQLFFDPGLSTDGQTACATCHVTNGTFTPNESRRAGAARAFRTVLPIAGAAHQVFFTWDGGKDSLWSQALGPLEHPDEHAMTRTEVVAYVLQHYADGFAKLDADLAQDAHQLSALPAASPIGTADQRKAWAALDPSLQTRVNQVFVLAGKAIAAFEASVPPPMSEWDRFVIEAEGQAERMPQDILRGFAVFTGKGRCSTCHAGPLFSDGDFHNTGLPAVDGQPVDMGRQAVLSRLKRDEFNCLGPYSDAPPNACKDLMYMAQSMERALGAFRTPTLRGVSLRGPFGHAGQMPTLADMIDHYDIAPAGPHGRMVNLSTLSELVPLALTEQEKADLIAFLNAL